MISTEEYVNKALTADFPLSQFDDQLLKKEYNKLMLNNYPTKSNIGLKIIENYHPSIWRCNIKNHKSPLDAWNDPNLLYKVIENRKKYLKSDIITPINIRSGFSISKIAPKVSIFRPVLAKYLVLKYLNEFNCVFDPCSGFSGRLLGVTATGKQYLGQDINSITISESNDLISDFNLNANCFVKNSLYTFGEYDCLFTCPPYGDKENWHQDIEVLSADEWIDSCVLNYTCKKYLFVVDNTNKYKNFIKEEIVNSSHFGTNTEKVILIEK